MKYPKNSIITPTLNQYRFIEETILSVLSQGYPNLEYIIVDGGSVDGTIQVIEKYLKQIIFISERDNGQVEAINKGINMSSGDIIAFINSDDLYYPTTLTTISGFFLLILMHR